MAAEAMTNEENYAFDVSGYLILRGALTPDRVAELNAGLGQTDGRGLLDPACPSASLFRDLMIHPLMVWYLNQIVSPGFRLESLPALIAPSADESSAPLTGGNEPREPGAAYYYQNGRRMCQAVNAVWALDDIAAGDGGLVLVPCSHKSNVEIPADVATGADDMGLVWQPELRAGDLLLYADALAQTVRPWRNGPRRLLRYEYVSRGVIRDRGTGDDATEQPTPEWLTAMSAEEQAAVHKPGYADTTPPPVLNSDGTNQWVHEGDSVHPSIYLRDPGSGIDENEFYFWDLNGHLVLRNILTDEELALANEAIDKFEDRIRVGEELSGGSTALAGTGRPTMGGLLQLPEPYCQPFRRMIAHPAVTQRLNWMGGSGWRCGGPTAFCAVKGSSGHSLHDANEPLTPSRSYIFQNGRSYCEAITVTWQLRDVTETDGGFACVPGSHKAQYRMPRGVRSCDDAMGLVTHPVMEAGDVLFFMDGAQTHGALAWTNDIARRGILIKYSSRSFNRSGGAMVHPEARWGGLVDGMTDAQLAMMRGPDRDVHGSNVPRLDVTDGEVSVSYERGGGLYSREAPTGPATKK
jgi:ectoine hydroxylase-related dioxygenase (phytanoyl-CoA dioxygenase family)